MNSGVYWYADAVVYHMFTLSLAKAPVQNDYIHQGQAFPEITKWIPHIKTLGCNTVLFSPLLKARTHGYDVTDYTCVDNRVGTDDEFRDLVDTCHQNGIRVVLDSVFNHSGRDFFAFRELCQGNKSYASWYSGVTFDRSSPLGDPFSYDTWSGHFELPKFNLGNEATRRYLLDAARRWIDVYDIDGMRLDAANELDFGFIGDLRRVVCERKPDFWLMGEVVHGDYARWVNANALHSVTNYMLFKGLFSSLNDNNLFELAHTVQRSEPQNGLPLYSFLDNHDQPRIASMVKNPEHLRTLYTLLFTLPGVPSLYYGSEWGIQGEKEAHSDQPLRPYIDIAKPLAIVPWLADFIGKLARIRSREEPLRYGAYAQTSCEYRRPFVFQRSYEDVRIFVAVHIQEQPATINLSGTGCGALVDLLSGERFPAGAAANLPIAPYQPRILKEEREHLVNNPSTYPAALRVGVGA